MVAMSYGATGGYPFGNGRLCLNPWDLQRASAPFVSPPNGTIEVDAFLAAAPLPAQWHYFQVFYRDTVGASFNLSSAVGIEFAVL